MSLINPTPRSKASFKPSARRAETAKTYAHPLPIIFPEPTFTFFGLSLTRPLNPHCTALFDPVTRSAWVSNPGDATILWQRGFFGKGDLSRSEPSWLARQINARKMKGKGTSFFLFSRGLFCRTLASQDSHPKKLPQSVVQSASSSSWIVQRRLRRRRRKQRLLSRKRDALSRLVLRRMAQGLSPLLRRGNLHLYLHLRRNRLPMTHQTSYKRRMSPYRTSSISNSHFKRHFSLSGHLTA